MATDTEIPEHTRIELIEPVERWPAGTRGTTVSPVREGDWVLVEVDGIAEADGGLDWIPAVPATSLRPLD